MLSPVAVERMARIERAQLATACDALLTRLRLIRRAARDGTAPVEECRRAHVEAGEALLNLLAVLEADGDAEVPRLQAALRLALAGAP